MLESGSEGKVHRQRGKQRTSTTETSGEPETGASGSRIRRIREREQPEPSVVWQTVAIFLLGGALAAGLGALMLSEGAMITHAELWALTGLFLAWAATCFLAQWDVNRGRKIKRREVEEEIDDE